MKKYKIITIISVIAILTISLCVYAASDDAIITLGYFNKQLDSFKTEITDLIDNKMKNINTGNENTGSSLYEIINVAENKTVIFGESTEFVVRRGTAKIVDPSKQTNPSSPNGVPNLTTGTDEQHGDSVKLQNLYMIPRDDGRGIKATTELTIMVRGTYAIK